MNHMAEMCVGYLCVRVWACTCALCMGSGHSLQSCLYRASMEMCCTTLQQETVEST